MANELVTIMDKFPAEFKAKLELGMAETLHNLSIRTVRLPRIKIGHANQTFSLPDDSVSKTLECWIVQEASFMEMYEQGGDEDENKIPICVAISDHQGSRFGDCNACPHFVWKQNPRNPDKKLRDCASTARLLLGIRGMSTPIELKIPQTSYNTFLKAVKEAASVYNPVPLYALDLTITLKAKKEGNQEWSLFEFAFASNLTNETPEEFMRRYNQRETYRSKYKTYFKDAYGLSVTVDVTPSTATIPGTADVATSAEMDKVLKAAARPVRKSKATEEVAVDAEIATEDKDLDDLAF